MCYIIHGSLCMEVDVGNILMKLEDIVRTLPVREARVAAYVLSHPNETTFMSINELSSICHSSTSTIVRLCKRLDLKGYRDLTRLLAFEANKQNDDKWFFREIMPEDTPYNIAQQICVANEIAVRKTYAMIDEKQLDQAVHMILSANRVDFYGIGTSGLVAQDASAKFMRICKCSFTSRDPHQQLILINSLKSGDVAVFISYSGETVDLVESMRMAKSKGAITISITRYRKSTVNSLSDIRLFSADVGLSIEFGPMCSRISQLTMIDILYSSVVSASYNTVQLFLKQTSEIAKHGKLHYEISSLEDNL